VFLFLASLPGVVAGAVVPKASDVVRFGRQIRPILAANCFACHGPDEEQREADLRLDTQEGAFIDLGGYQAIVPGKPDDSELYKRLVSKDDEERMPPPDAKKHVTAEQITLIRRWIEQGAKWQRQWSFVAPVRPELPAVRDRDWPHGPIDRFVLARLDAEGLHPSPEADRRTLLRRVTLDLTGLPPQQEEVAAFLADTSAEAYETVVDRLLDSQHYGEHMARFWLDAARYGDTHGLHLDNYREMWPYRDWVIRAFNKNMPYDAFTIEQLAGDLLPNATLDQKVASGFNRCHVTTNEGGSIAEEVYVRNVVDRVSTTGTVFLGLTLGCTVCHDHKFDPITQKEFYQLFAFFNNLDGPAMDGNVKDPAPTVRVPTAEQAAAMDAIRRKIEAGRERREERLTAVEPSFIAWLDARDKFRKDAQRDAEIEVGDGLLVHCELDAGKGSRVDNVVDRDKPGTFRGTPHWVPGRSGHAIEIGDDDYVDLGDVGQVDEKHAFSYGAWIRTPGNVSGAAIAKMDVKKGMRGYDLFVAGKRIAANLSGRWPGYAIKVTTKREVLKPDTWHHVLVTYDGSRQASGVTIYVDGKAEVVDVNSDSLKQKGSIHNSKPLLLGRRESGSVLAGARIDDVRIYGRRLSDGDAQAVFLSGQLNPILATPREAWSDPQQQLLRKFYLIRHDATFNRLTGALEKLTADLHRAEAKVATTLVFRERKEPRQAYLLVRGQYDHRGEKVRRATPASLPPMAKDLPVNRLGLARWLVAPEQPLTSRVAVNRFWEQAFGTGLVKTVEDFGSQGSGPSHPKLLDWLAVEFRESGWDVKALMKRIVMSATYRQTSQPSPELLARDPDNRLLARGPRFRLDAEMLRDQALAVSRLLVDRVGGPSVKPPQPAGLWHAVGYSGSNTVRFKQDKGPDKVYRRSLYTFWKRTSPPPEMTTFDAPSREACIVRRERTNTPLQALLLMNDPQFVEAARHLAERILHEAGPSASDRVQWVFQQVTMRRPTDRELKDLLALQHDCQATYKKDLAAADKLIAVGESPPDRSLDPTELATWTMVANLILNLDEVITKG